MKKDSDRNKRAVRDQAGVGPRPAEARHLTPLKELKKHRVAGGEPDVRGWTVFSSSGREVGKVADLLVDTARGEVVMLDIDLRDSDRQTLAPLRAAWVDRDVKRVVLDGAQFDTDEAIPSLRRGHVTEEEARTFGDRYVSAYGDRGFADDRDYHVGREGEELRFGRRGDREPDGRNYVVEHGPRGSRADDTVAEDREDWRDVRYERRGDDEQVSRSRPVVVEETVVRRRVVDESESDAAERAERPRDDRPDEGRRP